MTSKRTAAVALAKLGRRVFPLAINGKTPAHARVDWTKTATSDPARVYEMWTDPVFGTEIDYNIGRALDRDTLIVDTDVRDGKQGAQSLALLEAIYDELPPTCTVITPSGGDHREFTTEDSAKFAAVLGTDIDLKGFGGYVVAPGSTIDGKAYRLKDDTAPAPLPPWVASHAPAKRHRERTSPSEGEVIAELDTADAVKRAAEYLTSRAPDHGTFKVACRIKDYGVSREQCLDLMMDHWPPAEAKGTDHVEFRVNNAYSFGQNAVGIASPEAEFDAVEIDQAKTPPKRKGLNLHNIVDFKWSSSHTYMLQGLLNYKMLAMMSGPSNAGKSPLALDIAAHVAAGRVWRGRKVKQSYVLHYSTEGFTGLSNRMEAVKREHFPNGGVVPLDFVSGSLDLRTSASDAAAIVRAVKERSAHFGVPPGLVVIDTLSHALGGGDESNPEHVRAVLKNCAEIASRTGAAVILLHHPTKDASSDYRGSSIMLNDIDLLIKVEMDARTKLRSVSTPRVKEYSEIEPMVFKIKVVELGKDEEGDAVTSVVVDWVETSELEFADRLTPPQAEVLAVLEDLLLQKQADENETNKTFVSFTEWSEALKRARTNKGKNSGEKQALDRSLPILIETGLVAKTKDNQYVRTAIK